MKFKRNIKLIYKGKIFPIEEGIIISKESGSFKAKVTFDDNDGFFDEEYDNELQHTKYPFLKIIIEGNRRKLYLSKCYPDEIASKRNPSLNTIKRTLKIRFNHLCFVRNTNVKRCNKYTINWSKNFVWTRSTDLPSGGFSFNYLEANVYDTRIRIKESNHSFAALTIIEKGRKGFSSRKIRLYLYLLSFLLGVKINIYRKRIISKRNEFHVFYPKSEFFNSPRPPIPLSPNFSPEKKLKLLADKYWLLFEEGIAWNVIIDYYFDSKKSKLFLSNTLIFGLLEYFNAYYQSKNKVQSTIIDKKLFEKLTAIFSRILNKKLNGNDEKSKQDKESILRNLSNNVNSVSFIDKVTAMFNGLGIPLTQREEKEIRQRSSFFHGRGLMKNSKFPHAFKKVLENHQVMHLLITKIILRLLGYEGLYFVETNGKLELEKIVNLYSEEQHKEYEYLDKQNNQYVEIIEQMYNLGLIERELS